MISIVIPVKNGAKTILRALKSVALQGVEKEVIIIDDHSTDNTIEVVKSFKCDFNVKTYHNTNDCTGAPNYSRNIGVSKASGEYVAFIDADDWWEAGKLSVQLETLKKYDADICTTSFMAHNKITGTTRLHGKIDTIPGVELNMLKQFLERDKSKRTSISSMLFKKHIYVDMDMQFGLTDYAWTARMLENNKLVVVQYPLTHREVDSINTSYNDVIREMGVLEQLSTMIYYANKYGYDLEDAKKTTYGSLARYYYMQGDYKKARSNFLRAAKDKKTIAYYLTSFVPLIAERVSRKFNVWGDN